MISSIDLTSRASSITCCPSRTVTPSSARAASIGGSTMSTPIGMSATPSALRMRAISLRGGPEQAGVRGHGAAQADHAGVDVLLAHPRAVEPVVLGGRAEVPDVRVAAAGQQRVAGHLVARPLADVGARDVADVVEVEQQDRADLRRRERRAGASQPVGAQSVDVPALLPVDVHRARRSEGSGHRSTPVRSIGGSADPRRRVGVFIHATQPVRRRKSGRNGTVAGPRDVPVAVRATRPHGQWRAHGSIDTAPQSCNLA